jgi:hypothetical protein
MSEQIFIEEFFILECNAMYSRLKPIHVSEEYVTSSFSVEE